MMGGLGRGLEFPLQRSQKRPNPRRQLFVAVMYQVHRSGFARPLRMEADEASFPKVLGAKGLRKKSDTRPCEREVAEHGETVAANFSFGQECALFGAVTQRPGIAFIFGRKIEKQ